MSALARHRDKLVPLGLLLALLVAGVVLRNPIRAWFSGPVAAPAPSAAVQPSALTSTTSAKPKRSTAPPLPEQHFSAPVLASITTAFEAYESIRNALAQDTMDGIGPASARMATALRAAAQGLTDEPAAATGRQGRSNGSTAAKERAAHEPAAATGRQGHSNGSAAVKERLEVGAKRADALADSRDVDDARARFSDVSEVMVALVAADQRLASGRHVFECPMVDQFNKWVQPSDKLENPYMGKKMLTCGSESSWVNPPEPAHTHEPSGDPGAIAFYTCPMHPSVKQPEMGKCPMCGMDLVAVTEEEQRSGVVRVDAARRQLIGVKTEVVQKRVMERNLRTVGRITYDETRMTEVSLKFKGWIGSLYANATGKKIRRGQTLFTVYSPEIYAAQEELLLAASTRRAFDGGMARSETLVDAAKLRLRLWDVSQGSIDKVVRDGKPMRYVPIASPASGYIVEKNVFDGSAVEPGMKLLRIANLDKVWIEAELYEAELPLVPVGHEAKVTLSYLPGKEFSGKVTFVYPYLDAATRTGKVRIELANKQVELKPDMYANVELNVSRGEQLVVPDSAVIYAGPRRIVFVDLGQDRLAPREIKVGLRSGNEYEVLEGLEAGEKVVTSGNFLIAADSRLKSAAEMWR
ncbi:MAG: efflux RND transporter periplasmic adaptor subunit [Polyangiaceae bacterium]